MTHGFPAIKLLQPPQFRRRSASTHDIDCTSINWNHKLDFCVCDWLKDRDVYLYPGFFPVRIKFLSSGQVRVISLGRIYRKSARKTAILLFQNWSCEPIKFTAGIESQFYSGQQFNILRVFGVFHKPGWPHSLTYHFCSTTLITSWLCMKLEEDASTTT